MDQRFIHDRVVAFCSTSNFLFELKGLPIGRPERYYCVGDHGRKVKNEVQTVIAVAFYLRLWGSDVHHPWT